MIRAKAFILALPILLSPTVNGLVHPLRLAKKPLDSRDPGSGSDDQEAVINQWLATDAALRLRKGHFVDEDELNRFLVGCVGRCRDYGVVELTFDSGMKALVCAGEDGPFRMRRAGFNPQHVQLVMIGKTHVWYAQDGKPKPGGGSGGGGLIAFPEVRGEVERKLNVERKLKSQI